MHRSRALTVGASVLAIAGLAATPSAGASSPTDRPSVSKTASCSPTVTRLPDLGYGGGALAFNDSEVIGDVVTHSGISKPAIWHHGHLHVLAGLAPGTALDINIHRTVIGAAQNQAIAWARSGTGVRTDLKDAPGGGGQFSLYARRINARGQVAGAVDGEQFAARWDSPKAKPTVLQPAAGDTYSFSKGINYRGFVAGDTDDANFVPRPAVWAPNNGIHVYAAVYGADTPGTLYEINNANQSDGESFRTDSSGNITADVATLWSAHGRPASLGYLPRDNQSTALGLSQNGYVSGESSGFDYGAGQPTRPTHAFVWSGHGPLLALPVPGMSYRHSESAVHQIAANGTVVGSAGPVNGPDHAYVWTCAFSQAFRPPAAQTTGVQRPERGFGPVSTHGGPRARWLSLRRHP